MDVSELIASVVTSKSVNHAPDGILKATEDAVAQMGGALDIRGLSGDDAVEAAYCFIRDAVELRDKLL